MKRKRLVPVGIMYGVRYQSFVDGQYYQHTISPESLSRNTGLLGFDPKRNLFHAEFLGFLDINRQIRDLFDRGWQAQDYQEYLNDFRYVRKKSERNYDWDDLEEED